MGNSVKDGGSVEEEGALRNLAKRAQLYYNHKLHNLGRFVHGLQVTES